MLGWQLFSDQRFPLRFHYPGQAGDGETVERLENMQEGMLRVHLLNPKGRHVYFEITRYESLTAKAEYQQHKEDLAKQINSLVISELTETILDSILSLEYTFEWDRGRRTVLLVEHGGFTYRILYNPEHPINAQILSTVVWINRL